MDGLPKLCASVPDFVSKGRIGEEPPRFCLYVLKSDKDVVFQTFPKLP